MISARWLINLASYLLPQHRRDWAEAMKAELASITEPRDAIGFALGCLWTAICERMAPMKLIVTAGRWSVGLVAVGYGALFVSFLMNEFSSSELHNPYFTWLLPWQLAMASSHVAAGLCLIFWRPKAFIWSCALACLPASGLSLYGFLMHLPHPSTYIWPFIPIAMLAAAAAFLWWLDRYTLKPHAA